MELRRKVTEREIELGREHEHRQTGFEADAALDEAHADGDGHERDSESCRQLEHRPREKRHAQRCHRRAAVLLAHHADLLRLRLAAVEGAKRRQAADDVEEVRREERERLPPLAGALLRIAADQPHEHRHERQRQQHHPRGDGVDYRDEHEHRDRDRDGEDDLRQIAGERRLERVDSRHGRRGHLGALGAVERGGLIAKPSLDELEPQGREDVGRSSPADDLEARGCGRPTDRSRDEQGERHGQLVESGPVEGARRDGGDQDGLGEDEQRGDDAETHVEREQHSHGASAADEARVE